MFTVTGTKRDDGRQATIVVDDSRAGRDCRLDGDLDLIAAVTADAAQRRLVAETPTGPVRRVDLTDPWSLLISIGEQLRPGFKLTGDSPRPSAMPEPAGAIE